MSTVQSELLSRPATPPGSPSWAEPAFWLTLGLIGLAVASNTIGPELMVGDRIEVRSATGDTAVGIAGFRYFVNDDWHFPLLLATKLDAPAGTVIAFTDSIPLLGLVAKSLRGLGIEVERWWGLWFTSIFVCQSLAGGWAIRKWSGSRFVAPLLAVPLLLVFPPLLQRMFHPALAFQAPLLVALGLAACFGRDERRRWWWLAVALPVVSLLIHPYHVVPVLVVLSGGLIDAWRAGRVGGRYLWSWAASGAAALMAVAISGGYLWQEPAAVEGYGYHSLVPYSPFVPQLSALFPWSSDIILASGSFEGFAFVGMGGLIVLVLAAIALAAMRGRLLVGRQSLLAGVGLLVAYAITPNVHLGGDPIDLLASVRGPVDERTPGGLAVVGLAYAALAGTTWVLFRRHRSWGLLVRSAGFQVVAVLALLLTVRVGVPAAMVRATGTFRASGRLVWIACYLMLVGGIAVIWRRFGPRAAAVVLAACSLIQWFDQPAMRGFGRELYFQSTVRSGQLDALGAVFGAATKVHLVPEYTCANFPVGLSQYIEVIVAASEADVPIDNTYAARRESVPCTDVESVDPAPGVVTVGARPGLLQIPDGMDCRLWQTEIEVCADDWSALSDENLEWFSPLEYG